MTGVLTGGESRTNRQTGIQGGWQERAQADIGVIPRPSERGVRGSPANPPGVGGEDGADGPSQAPEDPASPTPRSRTSGLQSGEALNRYCLRLYRGALWGLVGPCGGPGELTLSSQPGALRSGALGVDEGTDTLPLSSELWETVRPQGRHPSVRGWASGSSFERAQRQSASPSQDGTRKTPPLSSQHATSMQNARLRGLVTLGERWGRGSSGGRGSPQPHSRPNTVPNPSAQGEPAPKPQEPSGCLPVGTAVAVLRERTRPAAAPPQREGSQCALERKGEALVPGLGSRDQPPRPGNGPELGCHLGEGLEKWPLTE